MCAAKLSVAVEEYSGGVAVGGRRLRAHRGHHNRRRVRDRRDDATLTVANHHVHRWECGCEFLCGTHRSDRNRSPRLLGTCWASEFWVFSRAPPASQGCTRRALQERTATGWAGGNFVAVRAGQPREVSTTAHLNQYRAAVEPVGDDLPRESWDSSSSGGITNPSARDRSNHCPSMAMFTCGLNATQPPLLDQLRRLNASGVARDHKRGRGSERSKCGDLAGMPTGCSYFA